MYTEHRDSDEITYELRHMAYTFRDFIDEHGQMDCRWAARMERLRVLIDEAGREVAAISLECDKALGEIT
jgi:hypothetical protein